jgi:hypothetical protein
MLPIGSSSTRSDAASFVPSALGSAIIARIGPVSLGSVSRLQADRTARKTTDVEGAASIDRY